MIKTFFHLYSWIRFTVSEKDDGLSLAFRARLGIRLEAAPGERGRRCPGRRPAGGRGPGEGQEGCFLAVGQAGTRDLLANSVIGRGIRVGSWGFMAMSPCLLAIWQLAICHLATGKRSIVVLS